MTRIKYWLRVEFGAFSGVRSMKTLKVLLWSLSNTENYYISQFIFVGFLATILCGGGFVYGLSQWNINIMIGCFVGVLVSSFTAFPFFKYLSNLYEKENNSA
jgi:hypothetical protein